MANKGQTRKANGEALKTRREKIELTENECNKLGRKYKYDRLGLSRDQLVDLIADRCEEPNFSVKTIQRAEDGERIRSTALFMISDALRMPYGDTWVPDEGDDPDELLAQMIASDSAENYAKAEQIGDYVRQRPGLNIEQFSHACTELAIARDHSGRWEEGINLLEDSLDKIVPRLRRRAEYQLIVLRRGYADELLNRARQMTPAIADRLREIRDALWTLLKNLGVDLHALRNEGRLIFVGNDGQDVALAVAAYHQLSVLEIMRGHFDEAIRGFRVCLSERQEHPADTFLGAPHRLAYEHL